MGAFLVRLKDSHVGHRRADGVIVSATNSADAIAIAKGLFSSDSPAAWADAEVTSLADVAANAPGMAGWRLRVCILGTTPLIDVEVVGTGANDTIDEIAALMVTALNATSINGASYTGQVLTVSDIADNLGDKTLLVEWYPPAAVCEEKVAIPGLVVSKVDGGIAGAALTVTFPADTYVVPTFYKKVQGRIE